MPKDITQVHEVKKVKNLEKNIYIYIYIYIYIEREREREMDGWLVGWMDESHILLNQS